MTHAHVGAVRNTSIAAERMLEDLPKHEKGDCFFGLPFYHTLRTIDLRRIAWDQAQFQIVRY